MPEYLKKYSKDWKLNNARKISSTATGDIFLVESDDSRAILKILNDLGVKDELPGSYFLKICEGLGAARLFKFDERALLMEYLPGENLYQFSKINNEKRASEIFCEVIRKIRRPAHTIDSERLVDYAKLFSVLEDIEINKEMRELFECARYLVRELLKTQSEEVILHGDLHHENIISRATGEFVCFDPKGMVGDPSYELGTTLKNPWDYPEISQNIEIYKRRAKYFSSELSLPYNRVIGFSFVHLCLSIAWALEQSANYEHQLKLAQKLFQTKILG